MAARETLAEHLIGGDLIRRGHRVFEVDRVEVTHGMPVRLVAHRTDGHASAAGETLILPMGEIVLRISP